MPRPVEADVVLACGEHLPAVDVWLVIDVLRASTVITRWFELGGGDLYPVGSADEARSLAGGLAQEGKSPLLMGEENAIPPRGFDLGNSPLDLTRALVRGHTCAVMSTSNGTKALLAAAGTGTPVLAACIRNASAALDCALSLGSRIGLLCAGRKLRPAWDDTLCAGLLLSLLRERHPSLRMADSARLALLAWRASPNLKASMSEADHAVFLNRIGYGPDVGFACETDAAPVVPRLFEKPLGEGMRAVLRPMDVPRAALPVRSSPAPSFPLREAEERPEAKDPFEELLSYTKRGAARERGHIFLGSAEQDKKSLLSRRLNQK